MKKLLNLYRHLLLERRIALMLRKSRNQGSLLMMGFSLLAPSWFGIC